MKVSKILVLVSCILVCFPFDLPAHARRNATEDQIHNVENGLLPPVVIKGQPLIPMRLEDRMAHYKALGVSVAVIQDGRVEWARGYGVQRSGGTAVTPDTLFQAASISKPVTATAVLHLVEEGKVRLDEDINRQLVSWKLPESTLTQGKKVTVRELLSHSAGISVHGFPGYASDSPVPTLREVLDGQEPANTPPIRSELAPGTRWEYSGGGYIILQQLILDVTKQSFPEFMDKTVLQPFRMAHSTFQQPLPAALRASAAVPYRASGRPVRGGWHTYPEMAAAGLWTTPSDLARFAIGLQRSLAGKRDDVLTARITREMMTRQMGEWGLGVQVEGSGPGAHFQHAGGNEGYRCFLVAYEYTGMGAAIMTNSDKGDRLAMEIIRSIAREYAWPDFMPVIRSVAHLSSQLLQQYAGRYQLDPQTILTLVVEDNHLVAQLTDETPISLLPSIDGTFFSVEDPLQLSFTKDMNGAVTGAHVLAYGVQFDAKRIGSSDK